MRSNADDGGGTAEALALLCITNVPPLFQPCTTLPEFTSICNTLQSRSVSSSSGFQWLKVEPDACARTTVVRILPTDSERVEAVREVTMWLQYALDQQRSRTYLTWWCPASNVASLKSSLLDLCDVLDPTHSIADWPSGDVASVFRKYVEHQRVRSRCSVLVLEHCSDASLCYFLETLCPAWGLVVFVLPDRRLEQDTTAALRDVFPVVDVVSVPPPTGSLPEMSEGEILDERSQTLLVPHVVRSMGFVTEEDQRRLQQQQQNLLSARSSNSGTENGGGGANAADEVDTSYLYKYMKETGYRPMLLRLCVILMRVSGWDSYDTVHALRERAALVAQRFQDSPPQLFARDNELLDDGPSRTMTEEAAHAVAVLELLLETVQEPNFAADMLVLTILSPLAVPMALFSPSFPTFIDASGIARRISHHLTSPEDAAVDNDDDHEHDGLWCCAGIAVPAAWLIRAFQMSLSEQRIRQGLETVTTRMARLDACVQRHGDDDARLFALHDQLSLGVKRVQSLHVDPSAGGNEGTPRVVLDRAEEKKHSGAPDPMIAVRTRGESHSADCAAAVVITEGQEPPSSTTTASPVPVRHREWIRWRGSVAHAVSQTAFSLRYFLSTPLPPLVLSPRIRHRDFATELVFGLPPIPPNENAWDGTLARLFLAYAEVYRSRGDFLNAAAATERALVVYLALLDDASRSATSRFAVLISPKIPNPEELLRRKSTMTLSRRGSRRASDASAADLQSSTSGTSQTLFRKMSRLTQMTHESNQSSKTNKENALDDQAYAHIFALVLLAVEFLYERLAADYCEADVHGVSVPLFDRAIATLSLLNVERRDTPARAMTSYLRGLKEEMLCAMERRRLKTIQTAEELQSDEGDMKLRALVKADVEERHHLRAAAGEMKECLNVLRLNQSLPLVARVASHCHEVICRHYLSEFGDKEAAEHAEEARNKFLYSLEQRHGGPLSLHPLASLPVCAVPAATFEWAVLVLPRFLDAIARNHFTVAHEMLDRCPYLAILGLARRLDGSKSAAKVGGPSGAMQFDEPYVAIVCDGCGSLTEQVLDVCFPPPTRYDHLQLWTNFSPQQVARHHGNDWAATKTEYVLPLHLLLRSIHRNDERLAEDGNLLFRRFMEGCEVNPNSASPHDMKTALHIAVELGLGDVTQYLLVHPLVDPLVAVPSVLRSTRRGLSTVSEVEPVPNPLPCPLYFCPTDDCTMLMILLMGSKDPTVTFQSAKVMLLERFAGDRESGRFLEQLFGPGKPFTSHIPALIVDPRLTIETRVALANFCPRADLLRALKTVSDPYLVLQLCTVVASWGTDGMKILQAFVLQHIEATGDFSLPHELFSRFPSHVGPDRLTFDVQREYVRWQQQQQQQLPSE